MKREMTLNQWLELDGQILRIVTNKHDYLVAVDDIMNTGKQIVEAGLKEGVDFKSEHVEKIRAWISDADQYRFETFLELLIYADIEIALEEKGGK